MTTTALETAAAGNPAPDTTACWVVVYVDLCGVEVEGPARYTFTVAREQVRYYRRRLAADGQFLTGAIPGYGICTAVRLAVARAYAADTARILAAA